MQVDFSVPVYKTRKLKVNEKLDEYIDLAKELGKL